MTYQTYFLLCKTNSDIITVLYIVCAGSSVVGGLNSSIYYKLPAGNYRRGQKQDQAPCTRRGISTDWSLLQGAPAQITVHIWKKCTKHPKIQRRIYMSLDYICLSWNLALSLYKWVLDSLLSNYLVYCGGKDCSLCTVYTVCRFRLYLTMMP